MKTVINFDVFLDLNFSERQLKEREIFLLNIFQ